LTQIGSEGFEKVNSADFKGHPDTRFSISKCGIWTM